jgi:hypothetical protein
VTSVRQVHGRTLSLDVDRPDLVVREGPCQFKKAAVVVMGHLRVDPKFLANAIWFYVGQPERRDAIGARAEYERLLPQLGAAADAVANRRAATLQ